MSLKDNKYSQIELMEAVSITCMGKKRNASIGMGLDCLNNLVTSTAEEFKYDCDEIDALCYHLDRYTCEEAIKSLQKY